MELMEKIIKAVDTGEITLEQFLDLSKAYFSVDFIDWDLEKMFHYYLKLNKQE